MLSKIQETRKSSCVNARGIPPRRVVSTPSVVLPGYPPPGGVPGQVPPPGGYPVRYPPWGGWYPVRYPPPGGVPGPSPLPHGILGNVAKHYGIWVPPPRCGQTNKVKLLPSRRTTYAGGNKATL